jgi:D-arabinose 1-dehydrogenase-like Zn-dependent alcohol dehydrogenase
VVGLKPDAVVPPPQRASRCSYVGTLDELHEVVGLGREGRIPPIPLDVRPLDAAPEAMADLRAGHVRGRVILKPDG